MKHFLQRHSQGLDVPVTEFFTNWFSNHGIWVHSKNTRGHVASSVIIVCEAERKLFSLCLQFTGADNKGPPPNFRLYSSSEVKLSLHETQYYMVNISGNILSAILWFTSAHRKHIISGP